MKIFQRKILKLQNENSKNIGSLDCAKQVLNKTSLKNVFSIFIKTYVYTMFFICSLPQVANLARLGIPTDCFYLEPGFLMQLTLRQLIQPDLESRFIVRSQFQASLFVLDYRWWCNPPTYRMTMLPPAGIEFMSPSKIWPPRKLD